MKGKVLLSQADFSSCQATDRRNNRAKPKILTRQIPTHSSQIEC